ncbi:g-protein alpha subunit [Ancylostoma ceylanicum]|uniref:G-protein alpha subunit n=1 Tax=Ancylostoma ceylanicum TaxID=53326 RepID=A0A0D6LGE7_9BILA|nr:g-protein alpha subunit [Ancylostoma ceylanicum]
MGNLLQLCCPPEPEPNVQKTKEREIFRFFMVGTGAAGKTTVVRQLKCLCKEKPKSYKAYDKDWNQIPIENIFTEQEMTQFRKVIRNNITNAVYNLIQQTTQWGHTHNAQESAQRIIQTVETAELEGWSSFNMNIPSTMGADILAVLKEPSIADTLKVHDKMARKWHIEDGTLHFLCEEQISRLFDDEAELTTTDIVHSRYPTTDIQDFRFSISKMNIQIHDMGGQPTELVKLPEFINHWVAQDREGYKNFVLFVTSMADFNVPDEDEPSRTALERSIKILEVTKKILNVDVVQSCGLLIFFNKQDRFDEIVTTLQATEEGRGEIEKFLGDTMKKDAKTKLNAGKCPVVTLHDALANKFDEVTKILRCLKVNFAPFRFTQAVDREIMADIFNSI